MSIISNVNYISKFFAYPCATPGPVILVELAFEALGPVLFEFFSLQIYQTLSPVAKHWGARNAPTWDPPPKPGIDPYKRARGHGAVHRPAAPPARRNTGEKLGPNTWLFRLADIEQRALFFWLIADLATEFMARWVTLIYMHQNCPVAQECHTEFDLQTIFFQDDEHNVILATRSLGCVTTGGQSIQLRAPAGATATTQAGTFSWHCQLEDEGVVGPPSGAHVFLRNTSTGETFGDDKGEGQINPDGTRSAGGSFIANKGHPLSAYHLVLSNPSKVRAARIKSGRMYLACGFCTSVAPGVPYDAQHLAPHIAAPRL